MRLRWFLPLLLAALPLMARADGAGDNNVDNVRRIPPPGIAVPDADRTDLQTGIDALGKAIVEIKHSPSHGHFNGVDLLPDVVIYYNAARYALTYNEFYNANEIRTAKALLQQGMERAEQLKAGKAPWTTQTGAIVRGYLSKIDGSVQPYGLIVPTSYDPTSKTPHRLDIWFHGRGENLTEVNFLNEHQHSMGEFAPADAFVLHPYGRFCNANRFAGEVDTFEAMDAVKRSYPIDDDRVSVRGFSMGGAACWDFGTHYAGDWAAINPGAGFSETADFLKVFQNDPVKPTWWEQKLWHMYDAIDYAINLYNCPTVAYSGELDGQRQAAEMMVKAMSAEGLTLTHIIGPGAHHFYEKNAKQDVAARVDAIVAKGRNDAPTSVKFTTWTLKYNHMKWLTLDGMKEHWSRARLNADISPEGAVTLQTENATAFTLNLPAQLAGTTQGKPKSVTVDGQTVALASGKEAKGVWTLHLRQVGDHWSTARNVGEGKLAKVHDLQGPIDDAFMGSFIMVQPSGTPLNPKVGSWVQGEMKHAIAHWRQQYRGEAIVKDDTALTAREIADSNLILWGDPASNKVLAKILSKLPIHWSATELTIGTQKYDADHEVPVLIYPNPLNPKRYIVINSGFTFREYDYLNNARQTPKLPDWAIVDIDTPPNSRFPGKIVNADFFGESWEVKPVHTEAVSKK